MNRRELREALEGERARADRWQARATRYEEMLAVAGLIDLEPDPAWYDDALDWPLYKARPQATPWVEPPAVMESLSLSRITDQ